MNKMERNAKVFGLILWVTIRFGTQEMYRNNPVNSDIISAREFLDEHTTLYISMILDFLRGETIEAIADKHADQIAFIKSVTHRIEEGL